MRDRRPISFLPLVAVLCLVGINPNMANQRASDKIRQLEPGPSPIGNPLQGLVPYAKPVPNRFPHSMEFNYLGLSRVVVGFETYDWKPLEQLLDDIASRGNQAVLRFYMEYPGKTDGIPEYLIERGLVIHKYMNTNTAPFPPQEVWTPDYEDPQLRNMLQAFIREFGKRYDNDPRLGFVTAGLLGTWGEWHTHPRTELWASHQVQQEVLDAYERHFKRTPILLRYPAGPGHYAQAENASRSFGYHDDSLCWATLETGREEDDWFFVPALKAAGNLAETKWKSQPIGGEIRPEVWGKIFDDQIDIHAAQSFAECAAALHLTWTMDTGMFREQASATRMNNALREVAKLGYEFYVDECEFPARVTGDSFPLRVHVVNQGLAPLYHAWDLEIAAVDQLGQLVKSWPLPGQNLTGLLPNNSGRELSLEVPMADLPPGKYHLLFRVVNPLPNGKPLQFANRDWATFNDGYLTLGAFEK